jgi:hypothetical protein
MKDNMLACVASWPPGVVINDHCFAAKGLAHMSGSLAPGNSRAGYQDRSDLNANPQTICCASWS